MSCFSEKRIENTNLLKKIEGLSEDQLESLERYINILDQGHGTNKFPEGNFLKSFMKMSYEKTGLNTCIAKLPIRKEMMNGSDVIHGGILATFIDIAMGYALKSCYPFEIEHEVTISLNIQYIKGGTGKFLLAQTELLQAGRNIASINCKVLNAEDEIVASASGTFMVWGKQ